MSETEADPSLLSLKDALQERLSQAKASSKTNFEPSYFVHLRVVLKPHHTPTRKTHHTEVRLDGEELLPGRELPLPYQLMIAQILPENEGFYLLHLDETGNETHRYVP